MAGRLYNVHVQITHQTLYAQAIFIRCRTTSEVPNIDRGLTYSAKQTGSESEGLPTARSKLVLRI